MQLAGISLKSSSFRAGTHTGPSRNWKSPATFSAAMAYVDDIAIFHDVFFALDVKLARFLELHFRGVAGFSGPDQVAVLHHLGTDETAGEVRMNGVGCVDR